MAQTNLNIRIDEDLKKQFEDFCANVGLNMTAAINIFAKKVVSEQRIPFEIVSDPFYSEENMKHVKSIIADVEAGKAALQEHELFED